MATDNLYDKAIRNIDKVIEILDGLYPWSDDTVLTHKNPFQLLIATILAAQSTDKLVNKVTPGLFKKYRSIKAFADADPLELQEDIRQTGFFRNKTKSLINCSRDLLERFDGKVPDNIKDLTSLYGVGRKTANVVLVNSFGREGIIVDTHMKRIAYRLGLTSNKNPDKIEFDLMEVIPEGKWSDFSHKVIAHGRNTCLAKKPKCSICGVLGYCRFGQEHT